MRGRLGHGLCGRQQDPLVVFDKAGRDTVGLDIGQQIVIISAGEEVVSAALDDYAALKLEAIGLEQGVEVGCLGRYLPSPAR